MIISKSKATWGEGANDALFELELVGNTPDEVKHLETLASEPSSVSTSFANGALSLSVTFTRKLTLEEQAKLKAEAEAKLLADAKQAGIKAQAEAQAKAFEASAQARANDMAVNQRAVEILKERAAKK